MATFINVLAPADPTNYEQLNELQPSGILAHALGMIDERFRVHQQPQLQVLEQRLNDLFAKIQTRFDEVMEAVDSKFGETTGKINSAMGIEGTKGKFDNFDERMADASKSFAIYKEEVAKSYVDMKVSSWRRTRRARTGASTPAPRTCRR